MTAPDTARAREIVENMMRTDTYSRWLGIEFLEIAPARVVVRMPVRDDMCNGFGVCHGGVTFGLADSAFAFACNTQGNVAVSIENAMRYPAASRPGDVLVATATEVTRSNRILYYQVSVAREGGELVGLFTGTAYRTEKPHPTP